MLPSSSRLLIEEVCASMRAHATSLSHVCRTVNGWARASHAERVRARGRGDPNSVRVILRSTLDTVSWWQEGIKTLD